jgi:hypothetical protein
MVIVSALLLLLTIWYMVWLGGDETAIFLHLKRKIFIAKLCLSKPLRHLGNTFNYTAREFTITSRLRAGSTAATIVLVHVYMVYGIAIATCRFRYLMYMCCQKWSMFKSIELES